MSNEAGPKEETSKSDLGKLGLDKLEIETVTEHSRDGPKDGKAYPAANEAGSSEENSRHMNEQAAMKHKVILEDMNLFLYIS